MSIPGAARPSPALGPRLSRSGHRVPAGALVTTGAVSVQSGAAVAIRLFARVGPAGAVTIRLVFSAVLLAALVRPSVRHRSRRDLAVVVTFGVFLTGMNLSFYEAIARIPLGVAVTVEFVGPLAVALGGSRRVPDLVWAASAGGGVALLATAPGGHLDGAGILYALLAGACWSGYILLSRETGRRMAGLDGLSLAMVVSAVLITPIGLAGGGRGLGNPGTLGLGVTVAVLSSVLPYTLELTALRRVSARAFGVLLSMDPVVAALAGLVIAGQHLGGHEVVALVLVVAANAGSSLAAARERRLSPRS